MPARSGSLKAALPFLRGYGGSRDPDAATGRLALLECAPRPRGLFPRAARVSRDLPRQAVRVAPEDRLGKGGREMAHAREIPVLALRRDAAIADRPGGRGPAVEEER